MTNLIIIQAKMGSSRLSGKVMMKLEEKSILEHIVNSLKFSPLLKEYLSDSIKRKKMSSAGKKLVDGRGLERFEKVISTMIN